MATAVSSISLPPARNSFGPYKAQKTQPSSLWLKARKFISPILPSFIPKQSPLSAKCSSTNGAAAASETEELSISIDVLRNFIDLNLGNWVGSFHQFDCNGNLLHKISTKLGASSYGDGELMSLIQSLYIKQPPISRDEESEWFEYKIKETNMFTVDKYQQIGFFHEEKAFALRYQTAGMLETVIRQGILGEDDTGEESPRNLKLPSRRPSLVCENCLYSFERDARVRAFHILDPSGKPDILIVFLEERGNAVPVHPAFDKDADRLSHHLGTWIGHSITKRSGVYGATIAEADTIAVLEMKEDGQLVQDIKSTSRQDNITTTVNWTGSISNDNVIKFDGGYELTLLPGGIYMGSPSDVANSVKESRSFHLDLCWVETPGKRQRLVRTYDMEGLAVSSTYFLETKQ